MFKTLAFSGLLSAFLVILNEWVKWYISNNHAKKKFELWKKVSQQGLRGLDGFKENKRVLYELLSEKTIEVEVKADGNFWAYPIGSKEILGK